MLIYNIRKEKYANRLVASGIANRWNRDDEFIIYTGSSIALSALELIAHRSAINIDHQYKLLSIKVNADKSDVSEIQLKNLPTDWKSVKSYPQLQEIGSDWYKNNKSLLLKVPSALVQNEYNYLINTKHPGFSNKVAIYSIENFEWDNRLL